MELNDKWFYPFFMKELITLQISKFTKNKKSLNVGTSDL